MEQSPVVAGSAADSVVMEHSPVVAGSAADSDSISYFKAASHIAPGATSDLMEAGHIPYEGGMKELSITFEDEDWKQPGTTLIAGDWTRQIDGMERKTFGLENFNFGVRWRGSPELLRACYVLRDGGAQLSALQEATDTLISYDASATTELINQHEAVQTVHRRHPRQRSLALH